MEKAKKILLEFKTKKSINILNSMKKETNVLFLKKENLIENSESEDKTFSVDQVSVFLER